MHEFLSRRGGVPRVPRSPVVPDALEEVQSLLQAVGLVVLPDDHVVAAAGHHEDDGSHIFSTRKPRECVLGPKTTLHKEKHVLREERGRGRLTVEALDPLAAFVALAAHVKHAAERGHLVTPKGSRCHHPNRRREQQSPPARL